MSSVDEVMSICGMSRVSVCSPDVIIQNQDRLFYAPNESGDSLMVSQNEMMYKSATPSLFRAEHQVKLAEPVDTKRSNVEESLKYKNDPELAMSGATLVFGCLYKLWIEQRLCDVFLQTMEKDILAHKVAIAAYSEGLAAKFNEFPRGEIININLSDMSESTAHRVVNFVYTNKLDLNDDNVIETLFCAREIGIEIVRLTCMKYINKSINPQNAFLFFNTADQRGLDDVKQLTTVYMSKNFTNMPVNDLGSIPFDMLSLMLQSDDIVAGSELDVFLTIVRWVDYKRADRLNLAPLLLKSVRYQFISAVLVVTKIETVEWLFTQRDCYEWLHDVMRFLVLKSNNSTMVESYPTQRPRTYSAPRESDAKPTLHYTKVNGSPSTKTRQWFEPIDVPAKQKDNLPKDLNRNNSAKPKLSQNYAVPSSSSLVQEVPTVTAAPTAPSVVRSTESIPARNASSSTSLTSYAPTIVAVGGIDLQSLDPDIPGRYIYRYHPLSNNWSVLSTMNEYLHHHGVVSLNDLLYVVGGAIYDDKKPEDLGRATDAVRVYNTKTRRWTDASPMNDKRAYLGITTYKGKIYVVGGENQEKTLDTIECYDPTTDSWKYLGRMLGGPKIGMGVAVADNCLYIVGGYSNTRSNEHVLSDVECFDLKQQRWVKKMPLPFGRCHANLVTVHGRLWMIGGRTHGHSPATEGQLISLDDVEQYDTEEDIWQHVTTLKQGRHDAGCVVLGRYIHVIGGMQSSSPKCLSSVECIDAESCQKVNGIRDLPTPAVGVACCYF